jgi:hypothetical protein
MRLGQEALFLQFFHDIADSGGTEAQIAPVADIGGAHRLGRFEIPGHHRLNDSVPTVLKVPDHDSSPVKGIYGRDIYIL